jgi:hypothetical protein
MPQANTIVKKKNLQSHSTPSNQPTNQSTLPPLEDVNKFRLIKKFPTFYENQYQIF